MLSGGLPTFIDISDNFASPEIKEDNMITQLHRKRKKYARACCSCGYGLKITRLAPVWPSWATTHGCLFSQRLSTHRTRTHRLMSKTYTLWTTVRHLTHCTLRSHSTHTSAPTPHRSACASVADHHQRQPALGRCCRTLLGRRPRRAPLSSESPSDER